MVTENRRYQVSVVVSTRNRADRLEKLLLSLVTQSALACEFEVVVVDNNSGDCTSMVVKEMQRRYPLRRIVSMSENKLGIAAARNHGARKALGSYIAFIDDDAVAKKDWVAKILKLVNGKKRKIFGGLIFPDYETKKPEWFRDKYETRGWGRKARELKEGEYLSGSNIVIEKRVFEMLKGFEEKLGMQGGRLGVGEETEFQRRARIMGIQLYYEPKLVVRHVVVGEKMQVRYKLKRAVVAGMNNHLVEGQAYKVRWVGLLPYSLVELGVKMIGMAIRDRKRYRYWQNYAVEELAGAFFGLGRGLSFWSR